MTQEMCKDFLAGSSNRDAAARQRYKLYMKATCLEQADEGLASARENVDKMDASLQVRSKVVVVKFELLCRYWVLIWHEAGLFMTRAFRNLTRRCRCSL